MSTENFIMVTAHPEFLPAAVAELKQLDKQLRYVEELTPDIALCETSDAALLMRRAATTRPVFARHLAPVQMIVDLKNKEQDLGEIAIATAQLPGLRLLGRGTRFAVQSRFAQGDKSLGGRPYTSGQLNRSLAEALAEETEAVEYIKKPEVVISLLCTMQKGYLGISTAEENLSSWPGGSRHFAQHDELISRAEFKLLEALEVFGVTLPTQGRALDLGAAPGGWTRLLLETGMTVYAVDPAHLDPRLQDREGLEHYQGYAEDFLDEAIERRVRFDVIVNDMRMDARDAARQLVRSALCLRPDGFVLSVFKLPHEAPGFSPLSTLKEALKIMSTGYAIVQARQLFHNRQEVTVVAAQPLPTKG